MPIALPPSFARAWDARGPRQRAAWIALALALVALAGYAAAISLQESAARTRSDLARNRLVLDVARARVAESATLARASAAVHAPDVRAAIARILTREGIAYTPDARTSGEPVRIVVGKARFDALVRALDILAREEGIRAVDTTFAAQVDPGSVRADLALAR